MYAAASTDSAKAEKMGRNARYPSLWRHATSAAPAAATDFDEDKIYTSEKFTETFVGPVGVHRIPDKGNGLCAQRSITVGDLILADQPIVFLDGPEDEMPEYDDLISLLQSPSLDKHARRMVSLLHKGSGYQRPEWMTNEVMNQVFGFQSGSSQDRRRPTTTDYDHVLRRLRRSITDYDYPWRTSPQPRVDLKAEALLPTTHLGKSSTTLQQ
eukprot:gene11349-18962_t